MIRIIFLSIFFINVANADCLDREDDRYAHEYYSNRYEANAERRRHSNDECNELFELRQRLKATEARLNEQRLSAIESKLDQLSSKLDQQVRR